MASASDRPVVLRRLGIIKDDVPFLQDPRAEKTQEDAMDLFAAESDSSSRRERVPQAFRAAATAPIASTQWKPRLVVMAAGAIAVVVALWAVSRLFSAETPVATTAAPSSATADPSSASGSAAAAATSTGTRSVRPAAARSVRAGETPSVGGPVAGGQQIPPSAQNALPAPDPSAAASSAASSDEGRLSAAASIASGDTAPPSSEAAPTIVDRTIYSVQDRDVQPPQTSEALPGPTISSWTTRTNAMEVIVSETGAVERVRLVTPPQRMPDMFMLSRAKVWKFTPAMKDGHPVRYRLRLTWEVNP